ncbi:MAG: hypothetical protein Q4C12_07625, partial [Clostridia bacterium]|nr:hypothetical protein [Clostridia bacterium]
AEYCPELMEVDNPIRQICDNYNPLEEELHEEICAVMEALSKEYRMKQHEEHKQGGMDIC